MRFTHVISISLSFDTTSVLKMLFNEYLVCVYASLVKSTVFKALLIGLHILSLVRKRNMSLSMLGHWQYKFVARCLTIIFSNMKRLNGPSKVLGGAGNMIKFLSPTLDCS